MNNNRQLADFITRIEVSAMTGSIAITIVIFAIFKHYDATVFTALTIISLAINSTVLKKYGYLIDKLSKKRILQGINGVMTVLIVITLNAEQPWLYLLLFAMFTLYFQIFYSTYNALSQTLTTHTKKTISVSMEMVGKLVYLLCTAFIWLCYEPLGIKLMLYVCVVLFLWGSYLLENLSIPEHSPTEKTNTHKEQLGFSWFFSQPIIWLVSLTLICHLVVLQSNTINPIYLYQVLQETPETLAVIGAAFSMGSIIGCIITLRTNNEQLTIYICFVMTVGACIFVVIMPTVEVFMFVVAIFGFSNSATRVMSRSLIMKNIANHQAGSFYSLNSSLASGIQFIMLVIMTILVAQFSPAVVLWFYPPLLLFVPIFWVCIAVRKINLKIVRKFL